MIYLAVIHNCKRIKTGVHCCTKIHFKIKGLCLVNTLLLMLLQKSEIFAYFVTVSFIIFI